MEVCSITASCASILLIDCFGEYILTKVALHVCCIELQQRRERGGAKRAKKRREVSVSKMEKEREELHLKETQRSAKPNGTVCFRFQLSVFCHLGKSVSHELMYNSPRHAPWLPHFPSHCFSFTTPPSFLSSPFHLIHCFPPTKMISFLSPF